MIGRFIYECDFALDFGFYDSGYKRLPPLRRAPTSFRDHCKVKIKNKQEKVARLFRRGTPLIDDHWYNRSEVTSHRLPKWFKN